MEKFYFKKLIDKIFELGILAKFFIGVFEFLAGVVYLISGQAILNSFLIFLAQQEVADDPDDFITNYLTKMANNFSVGSHVFAIIYLIFHGIINIFLAVALSKNKIWAYPAAIVGFGVFIVYQSFQYSYTRSPLLLILTIFDILVVAVILLEYRRKYKNK